jgi:hypothetical protein
MSERLEGWSVGVGHENPLGVQMLAVLQAFRFDIVYAMWAIAALTPLLSALWRRYNWRFSLRSALIAMTIMVGLAVLLKGDLAYLGGNVLQHLNLMSKRPLAAAVSWILIPGFLFLTSRYLIRRYFRSDNEN